MKRFASFADDVLPWVTLTTMIESIPNLSNGAWLLICSTGIFNSSARTDFR